jgi:hypothetical protein
MTTSAAAAAARAPLGATHHRARAARLLLRPPPSRSRAPSPPVAHRSSRRSFALVSTSSASDDAKTSPEEDASEDAPGSDKATLAENARCPGTVITSQANFLRVVVKPDAMTPAKRSLRDAQFDEAIARASAARRDDDVARLERRKADHGPHELLCVVRALLKKIKQRVLVGDGVDVNTIDWVDGRAVVEHVHARSSTVRSIHWSPYDRVGVVHADP